MTIPDYQSIIVPLLRSLKTGEGKKFTELINTLTEEFKLSDDEGRELLPTGYFEAQWLACAFPCQPFTCNLAIARA